MPPRRERETELTAIAPSRSLQARAQETCERLLAAGQVVLERGSLEAFKSTAVAAEAGVTPLSFYRDFKTKHVVLYALGRRLMSAQNAVIEERGARAGSAEALTERELGRVLAETLAVTHRFRGGRAVISALRAIPELAPIRLDSHAHVAGLIARQMQGRGSVR